MPKHGPVYPIHVFSALTKVVEIKAQSVFDKRSVADKWPGLSEPTVWNTFKLQFVAIGSLFRSRGMFRRVIVATVTMFFQQFTGINAGKLNFLILMIRR